MLPRLTWISFVLLMVFPLSGSGESLHFHKNDPTRENRDHIISIATGVDSDINLRGQIRRLADALNRRDLDTIRAQISPSRIYVEIADRTGAYLSNSQTLVVIESFIRSQTSIASAFDFVTDDGQNGSASGTLLTRKAGHSASYKLNFGFTKNGYNVWLLTRISIKNSV